MNIFDIKEDPKNRAVEVSIKKLIPKQKEGIRKAFYFIGKDLVKETNKLILHKPKQGRTYRITLGGRIVNHKASAAGEAPANLTGSLRKAIDFNVVGGSRLIFGVKETVKYGAFLEEGTKKMEERPFLITSIKNSYKNMINHLDREIKKEIFK